MKNLLQQPSMSAARKRQLAMAALVLLGSIMLGMGTGNLRLPVLAVAATAAGIYLTDVSGWFVLRRGVANFAALAAVGISLSGFFQRDNESQLLSIANLLLYLQVVLLFQEKHVRLYWQLIVLSLLQVVVGAALNLGLLFGVLMVVYSYAVLYAIALNFAWQEEQHLSALQSTPTADEWWIWFCRRFGQFIASLRDSRALVPREAELAAATFPRIEVLVPPPANFAEDLTYARVGRGVLRIGTFSVVVAMVVFLALPRLGRPAWRPPLAAGQRLVGYSSAVKLGSLGEVSQNRDSVLRLELRDETTGEPVELFNDLLLRGSVLNTYSGGEWSFTGRSFRARPRPLPAAPTNQQLTRQTISIEPLSEPVLFGIAPSYTVVDGPNTDIRFDVLRQALLRPLDAQSGRYSYQLVTPNVRGQRQLLFAPEETGMFDPGKLLQMPFSLTGPDPLAGLRRIAAEEVEKIDAPQRTPVNIARALERYLRSPRFSYTLQPQARDLDLDPIEDFIVNRPSGHCEYFATALALMLRSQNIPARVVVGFKGGDWNSVGQFYVVRQMHAHAWVEAYLPPEAVPEGEWRTGGPPLLGAWLTLDPTPSSEEQALANQHSSLWSTLGDAAVYVQMWWSTYVVGMDSQKQKDAVYKRLADLRTFGGKLLDEPVATVKCVMANIWHWITDNWLSWRGVLAMLFLLATMYGLFRGVRQIWRGVQAWRSRRAASLRDDRGPQVAFFRQFERLLARHARLRRQPGQTPLEFARLAAAQLTALPAASGAAVLPRRIVDAYYQVRYGRRALDNRELQTVEQSLAELENALAAKPAR